MRLVNPPSLQSYILFSNTLQIGPFRSKEKILFSENCFVDFTINVSMITLLLALKAAYVFIGH